MWSAAFTEALAPVPDIIGVERARKDYAYIMKRFSVLINRRQGESRYDEEGKARGGKWSPKR